MISPCVPPCPPVVTPHLSPACAGIIPVSGGKADLFRRMLGALRSRIADKRLVARKAYIPDQLDDTCKRILVAIHRYRDTTPALAYHCTSLADAQSLGYRMLDECFFGLLQHLAWRCQKRHDLVKQLVYCAPVWQHVSVDDFDALVLDACRGVGLVSRFVPCSRKIRSLRKKIIDQLKEGAATVGQIKRRNKNEHGATEVNATLKAMMVDGIVAADDTTKYPKARLSKNRKFWLA